MILCKSIPKWLTSGVIILSGGNIESRRGYFKTVTKKKQQGGKKCQCCR